MFTFGARYDLHNLEPLEFLASGPSYEITVLLKFLWEIQWYKMGTRYSLLILHYVN